MLQTFALRSRIFLFQKNRGYSKATSITNSSSGTTKNEIFHDFAASWGKLSKHCLYPTTALRKVFVNFDKVEVVSIPCCPRSLLGTLLKKAFIADCDTRTKDVVIFLCDMFYLSTN